MTAGWDRLKPLLEELLDLEPAARAGALARHCAGDPVLQEEVRQLLSADGHEEWLEPAAESAPAEPAVTAIGRYRVIEELGRGGQGVVYLAEDPRLGRRVAVKVLTGFQATSPDALDRFRREAAVASRLDHPGICTVYEVGEDEGQPWIAMQLVEGASLSTLIRRRREGSAGTDDVSQSTRPFAASGSTPSSPSTPSATTSSPLSAAETRDVLRLVESAARALEVAHEAGIVHRDVKPGNIVVREDGSPVLLDFGLARDSHADTLTRTGDLFGTPAYMAPEQIDAARGPVDRRTDVYALGVTLFECLALERPFRAATREELYRHILSTEPPALLIGGRPASSDLAVVVACAMDKDPDRRYATAADLAEDLRRVREHEPIRARAAGPLLRLRRWARRNPALAASLVGVFVILSVALALSLYGLDELSRKNREVARESEAKGRALDSEREALAGFRQMADIRQLEEALTEAKGLWPPYPQMKAQFEAWLARYSKLAERLPLHEASLAEIEAAAAPWDEASRRRDHGPTLDGIVRLRKRRDGFEAELDEATGRRAKHLEREIERFDEKLEQLEEEVEVRKTWSFAGPDAEVLAWKRAALADLVAKLRRFVSPRGVYPSVQHRLKMARTIQEETITRPKDEWDAVIARVAKNPRYGGLRLVPNTGIIPLGPDPESKLEEFLHFPLHRGPLPQRGDDGRIGLTPETGIILVLIPGGRFMMGSQNKDPAGPNYDEMAEAEEQPVHEVELDAFLLAKYETTQAQWKRAAGENPSYHQMGKKSPLRTISPLNPVENVSWRMAMEIGRRFALVPPSEAQWEYAARAGGSTRYFYGNDVALLDRYANIADEGSARYYPKVWPHEPGLSDGFDIHAPVGQKLPNAFGLHDVHGNVYEWCRYPWSRYDIPFIQKDGKRERVDSRSRPHRGGSYNSRANFVRVSARYRSVPEYRHRTTGVRFSVPLQP